MPSILHANSCRKHSAVTEPVVAEVYMRSAKHECVCMIGSKGCRPAQMLTQRQGDESYSASNLGGD